MALPALLGGGARAVGGSMIKSGGRAVASKVLGRERKKKTQPARIIPGRDVINGDRGGTIIKPNVKMVSAKEIKALQTGDTVSPGKDPLKSIYSNLILIEKILKGTNIADRDALKEQKKNDKQSDREGQEKRLETKPPKIDKKKGEVMKLPETGIFGFYIRGLAEYSGYCMAAASFFALAYTFVENGHIRICLLYTSPSPRD